ncbi:GNAT family N-acetyltransferase [Streptomyces sp. NPDC048639]|uniref:GNAT family N-acetyltransferase n=1 Tax=Streptomyces sp. NPDC048639 TaxID=3365581 RepID=UPI0037197200
MSGFPLVEISADRLILRAFGADDIVHVRALLENEERTALPPGSPADTEDLPRWLGEGLDEFRQSGNGIHLMMQDKVLGVPVGAIGLFRADWEARSAEVGYGVSSGYRSKGYATEALAALTGWALSGGGMQRIQLTANTDNTGSVRVAEKAGFLREGTLRRAAPEDDGLHDVAVFSRLDDDQPCGSPLSYRTTASRGD